QRSQHVGHCGCEVLAVAGPVREEEVLQRILARPGRPWIKRVRVVVPQVCLNRCRLVVRVAGAGGDLYGKCVDLSSDLLSAVARRESTRRGDRVRVAGSSLAQLVDGGRRLVDIDRVRAAWSGGRNLIDRLERPIESASRPGTYELGNLHFAVY